MQKRLLRWLEVVEHKANMGAEVASKEFVGKCLVWDLTKRIFIQTKQQSPRYLRNPGFLYTVVDGNGF